MRNRSRTKRKKMQSFVCLLIVLSVMTFTWASAGVQNLPEQTAEQQTTAYELQKQTEVPFRTGDITLDAGIRNYLKIHQPKDIRLNNGQRIEAGEPEETEKLTEHGEAKEAEKQKSTAGKIDPGFTFRLPASLRIIEDEAFEQTAITAVEIPESIESIGERAFANIPTLALVKMPETAFEIGKSAFTGSDRVTITGQPGSYARKWAHENGLPFMSIPVICAGTGGPQITTANSSIPQNRPKFTSNIIKQDKNNDKKPQRRPAGDIRADLHALCIASHLSGHSPPAVG